MTNEVVELFKRASGLPASDRETGVEAAWLDEVERRLAELDSGAVKTVPWEQVRAKLHRPLDEP